LESGHLVVPDRPGLGVEPTDEVKDLLKGGLC
jgi:L-alanine-DL-glutamate epimerase-like enolase superfamily enzyme